MITLRYGTNVVTLEKGQYDIRDYRQPTGESTVKELNYAGETRLIDKRRRLDGNVNKLALRLVVNYDERNILHNMVFGINKATLDNPIELTISDEGEINGVKKIRYSENEAFYDEKEVNPTMDTTTPNIFRFYSIDMLFYVL